MKLIDLKCDNVDCGHVEVDAHFDDNYDFSTSKIGCNMCPTGYMKRIYKPIPKHSSWEV